MTIANPDSVPPEELVGTDPPAAEGEVEPLEGQSVPPEPEYLSDATQLYLHEIGLNRLLAPEEELHYARRAARGRR
jgi:RNA polymerase nonessential primary-like sigma factor